MNFKDIDRAFVYNRGVLLHERSQAEIVQKQKEQEESRLIEKAERKQKALVNCTVNIKW